MTETRPILDTVDAEHLAEYLSGLAMPFTVTVRPGKPRTLNQNSTIHKWFGEGADHLGLSPDEWKGQCHHKYGLPIRLQDPQFAWIWERTGAKLNYEQQCRLLGSGTLGVTSKMITAELKQYMDHMQRDCLTDGTPITIPEAKA